MPQVAGEEQYKRFQYRRKKKTIKTEKACHRAPLLALCNGHGDRCARRACKTGTAGFAACKRGIRIMAPMWDFSGVTTHLEWDVWLDADAR